VAEGKRFFGAEAERLATVCHRMAERFARGGRLLAVGATPVARSDVRHVTVEFVHPVIVGKRALPAIGIGPEGGALAAQLDLLARPDDIVMAFDDAVPIDPTRRLGCLTIGFVPSDAAWVFTPETGDPFVDQELIETLYHVLWELVHVFFEHRGLLEGRAEGRAHDAGGAGFLYPFLAEQEHDLDAVVDDVRRSVLAKAGEIAALRTQTLTDNHDALHRAAQAIRAGLDGGGQVLALGNGGSATDAMDAVADLRTPPRGWPSRAALDLTEDTAIITAVANDIGTDAIFARQVIAHGRAGDVLLALSTSGNSPSILSALEEARRRDLMTIACVGYDGGEVAARDLADHVIVTRSQHIPRIQEAQASAWHVLRELVEDDG
jgi:D-sedoheptulose 7-phosphate isomerase